MLFNLKIRMSSHFISYIITPLSTHKRIIKLIQSTNQMYGFPEICKQNMSSRSTFCSTYIQEVLQHFHSILLKQATKPSNNSSIRLAKFFLYSRILAILPSIKTSIKFHVTGVRYRTVGIRLCTFHVAI